MSKNTNKKAKSENTEEFAGITASKVRFPLYVYPETMKTVDMIYKSDNCNTKTEFVEKAVRFYCGYLMQNNSGVLNIALTSKSFIVTPLYPIKPPESSSVEGL